MPTQAQIESDIRHSIEDEREKYGVDPTKNVRELVWQESKYQDGMRDAEAKYSKAIRQAEIRRLEELSWAETRRIDALDSQRVRYEARIAEDLRVNVKTTSDQLAGQLIKETGALNNQIATLNTSFTNQFTILSGSITSQITSMTTGINSRLSDLEKFRWETGGKTSVADPALTLAMSQMAESISALKDVATRSTGREQEKVESKDVSRKDNTLLVSIIVAIVGGLGFIFSVLVGVATIVLTIMMHK
jgi:hypothetical protein